MTEEMRKYVGSRYVPIFGRKGEESIEWDNTKPYEPLTIVLSDDGDSYTSRQYVPIGVELTNEEYWAKTGDYNAQVELYRQEVEAYTQAYGDAIDALEDALPIESFSENNTIANAISNEVSARELQDSIRGIDFNTVAEMKSSVLIEEGMLIHTMGYHSYNDGGGAWYKAISSNDTANDFTIISLQNSLKAILVSIAIEGYVDIRWTGAVSDFVNKDTAYTDNSTYFQKAINYVNEHRSTPIKIIGRYGISDTVTCDYSLQMFGEYRPTRQLNLELNNYNLIPISEIFIAANTIGFNLTGSSYGKFAYINIDRIRFTGAGQSSGSIGIYSETFGAPSRPNWINECEINQFDIFFKNIAGVSSDPAGTSYFNFDFSNNNCYWNNYVFYCNSNASSQATLGNVICQNSVLEQGGGQLYIKNSFASISLINCLLEGLTGDMYIEAGGNNSVEISKCYFEGNGTESNRFKIHISNGNFFGWLEMYGNYYWNNYQDFVTKYIWLNIKDMMNDDYDNTNFINESGYQLAESYTMCKIPSIERGINNDKYNIRTNLNPIIVDSSIVTDVLGSTSSTIRKGLYVNHLTDSYTVYGPTTQSFEIGSWAIVCVYCFSETAKYIFYTGADKTLWGENTIRRGLNLIVYQIPDNEPTKITGPTTLMFRFRNGDISNIVVSKVSDSDIANVRVDDLAYLSNVSS